MNGVVFLMLLILAILLASKSKSSIEGFQEKGKYKYIFWTGGYDSTFCILKSLLVDNDSIIPVYLSGNIDNKKLRFERHNKPEELQTMNKIRSIIHQQFPEKAFRLQPLLILDDVKLSKDVNEAMKTMYYKYDIFTRPFNQYGSMAQASLDLDAPIDLGYHWEDSEESSKLYKTFHKLVKNGKISTPWTGTYDIFKNFRFPIINSSKQDMLEYAKVHNFDHILYHTWSCWEPKNGKPCGKCNMCRERIIPNAIL